MISVCTKKLQILGIFMIVYTSLFAQTVSIGNPATYTYSIFNMQDPYTRHAAVYTSSEIGTAGTITSIGWNIKKIWSNGNGSVRVYLKENTNMLGADTWANLKSAATLVYDNTVTFPATANNVWFTINLSTPFNYSSGNLLVLVESNYGGSGNGGNGGDIDFNCSSGASGKAEYWWGNPLQTIGTLTTNRPMFQITFGATTSINNIVSDKSTFFHLFPNPAVQSFNYLSAGINNAEIIIYSTDGKQVYAEKIQESSFGNVDVSMLPRGLYIVRIVNEKINMVERLSVE